jgi:hypothetical protein
MKHSQAKRYLFSGNLHASSVNQGIDKIINVFIASLSWFYEFNFTHDLADLIFLNVTSWGGKCSFVLTHGKAFLEGCSRKCHFQRSQR